MFVGNIMIMEIKIVIDLKFIVLGFYIFDLEFFLKKWLVILYKFLK